MSRIRVIILVVALLLLGGAATWALWPQPWRPDTHTVWPPDPPFDPVMGPEEHQTLLYWGEYRPNFKKDIDRAGDDRDCAALKRYQQEALSDSTQETLVVVYINRWGVHRNCPEFAEEIAAAKEGWGTPMPPPVPGASCDPNGEPLQFTPDGKAWSCEGTWKPTADPRIPPPTSTPS